MSVADYRAERDQLVVLREFYPQAVDSFVWPNVGGVFAWGIDWRDARARGTSRMFAELATLADQLGV